MIDTHAHLDFKEFDKDREETIKRFFETGGRNLINVGCDLESSRRSLKLAENNEKIFASVGVHPHDAGEVNESSLRELEDLIDCYKVVAVGEIGLDFYRHLSPKDRQIEAFKSQLELAENHNKPVIIHCRDAYVDLLDILKNYKTEGWRGAVHCFLGSREIAEQFLNLGFHLGFTGAITYAKKIAINDALGVNLNGNTVYGEIAEPEIFKVIKNTPSDKILIETDCPFLAPVPMRGKRNEPAYVKYVAEKIAETRGISAEEIEKITSDNAKKLFGF